MKKKYRSIQKWIDEHEEWVRLGAAVGVVAATIGLGVGLSRTAVMDAQDRVNAERKKNEKLHNEIVNLWGWIGAQEAAGVEFKTVDGTISI